MPIIVITKDYFSGGRNITEDPDSKRELADLIIEAQTAINANTLAVGAHAARHITGGGDTIASAVAGGAAGLMTGADKTKLDGVEALADVTDATNVAAAGAVMDGDFAGATLGPMVRTGVGTYAVIQHNLVAVVAPGVGDDDVAGYGVGSKWIDTALGNVYECVDPTTGAAVWRLCLNAATAGGELAGTYPNPTVADGVLDANNARSGALPGLVVDKGVPSSVVVAFDDGAGNADRPADGDTYAFSIGGVLVATLEAADAPATEDEFLRSSAGAEEADTILMAAAFAAAINAHSVLGLRVHADVYGGAGDGQWYVECRTTLQADITAASALTCVLAGTDPGEVITRATAVAASKSQLFPFRYAVTAQDVLAGEIRFAFGCTAITGYSLDVLTAAADYTRIAWDGAVDLTGGRLTVDNGGGTDWAAGNILTGWVLGTVA